MDVLNKPAPELDVHNLEKAVNIMAHIAVYSWRSAEIPHQKRSEIMASFVLACALHAEDVPTLEYLVYSRLVAAGASSEGARDLATKVIEPDMYRKIASLSYFDDDYKEFGLRKTARKRWLEPGRFVDSILRLGD